MGVTKGTLINKEKVVVQQKTKRSMCNRRMKERNGIDYTGGMLRTEVKGMTKWKRILLRKKLHSEEGPWRKC
jgi:hypothetical protein